MGEGTTTGTETTGTRAGKSTMGAGTFNHKSRNVNHRAGMATIGTTITTTGARTITATLHEDGWT
jgi:hypothetical protein